MRARIVGIGAFDMFRISLVIVALWFFAISAFAGLLDGTVLINRAANNKTITVTYDGIRASLVELRINGESIATRMVSDEKTVGETNFTLNPATLKDGVNDIEIRLYDTSGKQVGNEKSSVTIDRKANGPVYMKGPKNASTVTGPVQIELGLKQEMKDLYVSFFVDDEFKSLRNFPPYTYLWDTTRLTNGWHEVQAWVVDDENTTHKTEKVRLYVNNPSGRTERLGSLGEPTPKTVASDPASASAISGNSGYRSSKGTTETLQPISTAKAPKTTTVSTASKLTEPGLTQLPETAKSEATTTVNETSALAMRSGTRDPEVAKGAITGQRMLLPTGTREVIPVVDIRTSETSEPAKPSSLALRNIEFGTRLFDQKTFSVLHNGKALNFDVAPRVLAGVPFAPFRHLFEEAGGEVKWIHDSKTVEADGLGNQVRFTIGALAGTNNGLAFKFEMAPFIESGRTVVPLSFVSKTLDIKVQYDPNTGHVLISNKSGK